MREPGLNPSLPVLIVCSKGHGGQRRRSNGQRITRAGGITDSGFSNNKEASFDIAYQIAINSRILLDLLGACTGVDFPEDRNVWLHPFKYLIAYELEIKQALREAEVYNDQLEARLGTSGPAVTIQAHDEDSIPATKPMHERGEANADNAVDAFRAKAEMDQLRCLVDFMDSDMQDIFDVKRQVANQSIEEIAFEHLWLLYAPGDLVYTNQSPEGRGTYQAYRVLHVTGGRPVLDTLDSRRFDPIDDRNWENESDTEVKVRDTIRGSSSSMTCLIVDCFSIDFDGNQMGPKPSRFVVPAFKGKRKMDALELYPFFSPPQQEKLRAELVERGRNFTQLANGTHRKYSGMTLRETRELAEHPMGNYTIHAEEVLRPSTIRCPFLVIITFR